MTEETQQADKPVNILNPEGALVSIPHSQLGEALQQGYQPAKAEHIEAYKKEQKYGSAGQQAVTALESAARGATFGLAPAVEQAFGVNPVDIRTRAEVNPKSAVAGEIAGLVGSSLIPGGEGAVAARLGELGASAVGAAEATSTLGKIGSYAVRGAIENAVVSGSDEVAKAIVKDPHQSAQTALADVGLASMIGAGGGAAFGAVSPLWNATMGPKVDAFLRLFANRVNGDSLPVSQEVEAVLGKLGDKVSPEMKAAFSENQLLKNTYQQLRESGTSAGDAIRQSLEQFQEQVGKEMTSALGGAEGLTAFDAGEAAKKAISDKADALNASIRKQYDALNATNENIIVPDESRLKFYNKLVERGQEFGAKDGPGEALFRAYAERALAQDSIQQLDKLVTEIGSDWSVARRAGDFEKARALSEIKDAVRDFQDNEIGKAHKILQSEGFEHAEALGRDLVRERQAARKSYADFIEKIGDIADVGKLGKVKSYGQLIDALDSVPSAKLADRLFDKKNVEGLNFLKAEFPDVLEKLISAKKAEILEAATHKGNLEHNVILRKVTALPKEVQSIMFKPEELNMIQGAGRVLRETVKRINPSGTSRGLDSLWSHMPAGGAAAVSVLTGHNPIVGAIVGQGTKYLARDIPDAVKLSMLKFIGSAERVDAGAWKAAADAIASIYAGNSLIEKGVKAVYRAGQEVLPQRYQPTEKQKRIIEKRVDEFNQDPTPMLDVGGKTAHYMPEHGAAIGAMAANVTAFLVQAKPKVSQVGLFEKPIEPSDAEKNAYDRVLSIAQQPLVVLEHIKSGELQSQDVQAIRTMYPALYGKLSQQLMSEAMDQAASGKDIPYDTKLSLSLFLGQPLDGTMQPQSMQEAQALLAPQPPPQMPSPKMGKIAKSASKDMTPDQARESARQARA